VRRDQRADLGVVRLEALDTRAVDRRVGVDGQVGALDPHVLEPEVLGPAREDPHDERPSRRDPVEGEDPRGSELPRIAVAMTLVHRSGGLWQLLFKR